MSSIYDIQVKTIEGEVTTLEKFKGRALLIVNTATKCGYTPQFEGLNALYKKYKDQGLVVLGFPCNQFMNQEPLDEKGIANFCDINYKVEFPMFAKLEVNGPNTHPLYQVLKKEARGFLGTQAIKWNFTKFFVTADGKVKKRYATRTTPEEIDRELSGILS